MKTGFRGRISGRRRISGPQISPARPRSMAPVPNSTMIITSCGWPSSGRSSQRSMPAASTALATSASGSATISGRLNITMPV